MKTLTGDTGNSRDIFTKLITFIRCNYPNKHFIYFKLNWEKGIAHTTSTFFFVQAKPMRIPILWGLLCKRLGLCKEKRPPTHLIKANAEIIITFS